MPGTFSAPASRFAPPLLGGRPLVRRQWPGARKETACITREEVGTVLLETTGSVTDLLKLSRLRLATLALRSRSIFGGNEGYLGQFNTTLVFERHACRGAVPLTVHDDEALIRPEPYLDVFPAPV